MKTMRYYKEQTWWWCRPCIDLRDASKSTSILPAMRNSSISAHALPERYCGTGRNIRHNLPYDHFFRPRNSPQRPLQQEMQKDPAMKFHCHVAADNRYIEPKGGAGAKIRETPRGCVYCDATSSETGLGTDSASWHPDLSILRTETLPPCQLKAS